METTRTNIRWLMFTCLLILIPTISFPFGTDHGVFFQGGHILMNGGLLYYDFIDVKPPMLYLLYGFVGTTIGASPIAMRIADLLWQLGTIYFIIQLLRWHRATKLTTWCTVVLYSVLYTTLGHTPTVQAESFFALPMVGTLLLVNRKASWSRDLLIGLCTGFAFLLKYPLAIIGPGAVLLFLMRGDGWRTSALALLRIGISSALFILAVIWPMITDPRFLPAFTEVMEYLKVYSASLGFTAKAFIMALDATGDVWGNNISLLVCIALAFGIMSSTKKLTTNAIFFMLLLFATVVLENKYFIYHFSRMYVPLVIVAGFGLAGIIERARIIITDSTPLHRIALVCSAIVLLLFSPFPRYANVALSAAQWLGNPNAVTKRIAEQGNIGLDFNAMNTLLPYIQHNVAPTADVMVISMSAPNVTMALNTYDVGPFSDSHFYLGVGHRAVWHQRAMDHLLHSSLVAVAMNDRCDLVNLHTYTSFQAVQRDSIMYRALTDHFDLTDTVDTYLIYKPKQ